MHPHIDARAHTHLAYRRQVVKMVWGGWRAEKEARWGDEEGLKGKLHSCIGLWISIFLVIRLTASRVNESVLFFIAYFRNEEAQFGKVGQFYYLSLPLRSNVYFLLSLHTHIATFPFLLNEPHILTSMENAYSCSRALPHTHAYTLVRMYIYTCRYRHIFI